MRSVPLTRGYVALVDDKDYARVLAAGPWHVALAKHTVYAVHTRLDQGKLYLHRFILEENDPKIRVDHKDRNGLNCRRHNLRRATPRQNQHNKIKRLGTSSRFKGVHLPTGRRKWHAHITVDSKSLFLGSFCNERDAALAYDAAALQHFGEFALTNF